MSMARVPGGTFKVENNMLVFEAEENSAGIDEFNSQRTQKFKKAADILNNEVKSVEGEFVGVCDSKERVFVAVNFPSMPSMSAEVYEISVQNPVKFLNLIDEQSLTKDNRVYGTFKRGTKILKICSSGKENAAILVEESQKKYVLLRVLTFQGENTSDDFERQWGKKWEMFSRTWYEYPIKTDGEEKMVVDIKCDQDSCIATTDDGKEFECMFNSSFGVIDDGNQIKPTYKQVGRHSEWILKTNCGMVPTDITSDLPPYSGNMRNTDLQMEYKRDLVAMSNKSGVTGYRNQYLVNFNTDGKMYDQLQQEFLKNHQEQNQKIQQHYNEAVLQLRRDHDEFVEKQNESLRKISELHKENIQLQKNKRKELTPLFEECKKIEDKLSELKSTISQCEQDKNEAEQNFELKKESLEAAKMFLNNLCEEQEQLLENFRKLEAQIKAGGKKASDDTSSLSLRDSKTKSVKGNNNTEQVPETPQGVLGRLFRMRRTNAENELDLENIAHFSAPRENRCTYV